MWWKRGVPHSRNPGWTCGTSPPRNKCLEWLGLQPRPSPRRRIRLLVTVAHLVENFQQETSCAGGLKERQAAVTTACDEMQMPKTVPTFQTALHRRIHPAHSSQQRRRMRHPALLSRLSAKSWCGIMRSRNMSRKRIYRSVMSEPPAGQEYNFTVGYLISVTGPNQGSIAGTNGVSVNTFQISPPK